jgi:ABC-type spermidine/putrescine transport system permease subunit II
VPCLRTLDASIVEAARDLGAGTFSAFMLVTLPLLVPALISSVLICHDLLDEFAIASLLAPPDAHLRCSLGTRTPALGRR